MKIITKTLLVTFIIFTLLSFSIQMKIKEDKSTENKENKESKENTERSGKTNKKAKVENSNTSSSVKKEEDNQPARKEEESTQTKKAEEENSNSQKRKEDFSLSGALDAAKGAVNAVAGAAKGAVNAVAGAVNKAVDKVDDMLDSNFVPPLKLNFGSTSSSSSVSSITSSMSQESYDSFQGSMQYGIGFVSDAIFDSNDTINFARGLANAIFYIGDDENSRRERQSVFNSCFLHLNLNQEKANKYLKRFWEECNKISNQPMVLWNHRIFESTLMEFFKDYTVPNNRNMSCDRALKPFAPTFQNPEYRNLPKLFSRLFDGHHSNAGDFRVKQKFLYGANANRRQHLPNQYFRKLNDESRTRGALVGR